MWIRTGDLVLPGGRVRLEPVRTGHAPGLFAAVDDAEVWRLRPDPRLRSEEEVRGWIAARVPEAEQGVRTTFVTVLAASGEVVGTSSFLDVQPANRALEIGATIVAPRWQRTFVNTEAKLAMLTCAFETLHCERVQFKVDTRNERSMRAVERIGAVREGVLRKSKVCHDGYIRDTAVYSIVRAEWPGVRARLAGLVAAR